VDLLGLGTGSASATSYAVYVPAIEGTTGVCNYEDNYGLATNGYVGPPH
jgi:hypothetical protein